MYQSRDVRRRKTWSVSFATGGILSPREGPPLGEHGGPSFSDAYLVTAAEYCLGALRPLAVAMPSPV